MSVFCILLYSHDSFVFHDETICHSPSPSRNTILKEDSGLSLLHCSDGRFEWDASIQVHCYLTVSNGAKLSFVDAKVAQREGKTGAEEVINIGLGPPSSREPLIDIASGPLFRFLVREKLQQPRPPLPYFLQPKVSSKMLLVQKCNL